MNASYYRSQLGRKNKARADAEKKVGEFRKKEADKRSKATKERAAAAKASSQSTVNSKLRTAQRHENEANKASQDASTWSAKVGKLSREAADLSAKLAKAEQSEQAAAERARQRERQQTERRAAVEQQKFESRLSTTESQVRTMVRELRAPKSEKLRVLLLAAASVGDLRVGQEQQRIRAAVQSATHRDLVELDLHPAATADVFLDALTRFRPHIVHFSGHSTQDLIVFEKGEDGFHEGAIVSAGASPGPSPPWTTNRCRSCSTPATPQPRPGSWSTPSRSPSRCPPPSAMSTPSPMPPGSTLPSRTASPCRPPTSSAGQPSK